MCYFKAFNSRDTSDFLGTIKALINAWAFIRIVTFHREGVDVYKKLECSQSIFEKPKHSVCFYTSVPCLAIV